MHERYQRQMVLPEVGVAGQARLAAARVLVVGVGGLGCAALPYLVGAGVGALMLIDPDRVALSNLHRQTLYRASQVGAWKVEAARDALLALNPELRIEAVAERLGPAAALRRVAQADVVLDAADSFAVTYLLSDACRAQRRTLVSASVVGLQGYVGVFCGPAPSVRAVFPELPQAAGSCAESGVLGSAVGVLGSLQAHLTLGALLGWEPPVHGRMITLDLRTLHFGGFSFAMAAEPTGPDLPFIDREAVEAGDTVVDLRGALEAPVPAFPQALRLSVQALEHAPVSASGRIVLCCRSGLRAWHGARTLQRRGYRDLALLALGE
ncbi:MAG: ThiF family adenylyltransferase [Gammaproteobacteria bacterium]|nr:ThiF family adenylyltransferase [Gammaproteobacteria bacterium]MBV9698209.1 ThiF family adenylyltransferase [Gammaproteobacteria bacterium]